MKRALVALAAMLVIAAGCGTAGQTPAASTTAAPAKLTAQERAALTKIGSAALKTDRAAFHMRGSLFAGSDAVNLKAFRRAERLLDSVDPHATDDARGLDSGSLDRVVEAYETYRAAALTYARAFGDLYRGADTGDRVMNAQKAVDAARDGYLASVKELEL